MRILTLIALSLSLSFLTATTWAQAGNARPESSSTLSTSSADFSQDQTFSHFQRVTQGMKPPKATDAPDPKFPDLPPDAEPRGTVVMLVGINAKGRVEVARVLRSDEPAFEASAVTTVKKWKFRPAEKNGHAVPVQVTVEMKFEK
ncbi:MAG: energy transducer TonB [Candidatus Korobacteraceae bacterium]|jgi:TonB family protein